MELSPKDKQVLLGTIYLTFDATVYLVASIYFKYVSKQWMYYSLIGYIFLLISCLLVWIFPESPVQLAELNRLDEVEAALLRVAWIGGKKEQFNPLVLKDLDVGLQKNTKVATKQVDSVLRATLTSISTSRMYVDEPK